MQDIVNKKPIPAYGRVQTSIWGKKGNHVHSNPDLMSMCPICGDESSAWPGNLTTPFVSPLIGSKLRLVME